MDPEEKEGTLRYAVADIERRKYPRFPIRVPIEYHRTSSSIGQTGETVNISEGGLQILFPEKLEVGQQVKLKLFSPSPPRLQKIEMLAEVVWVNTQLREGERLYRSGVRFINVSREDLVKLKDFLASLSEPL